MAINKKNYLKLLKQFLISIISINNYIFKYFVIDF